MADRPLVDYSLTLYNFSGLVTYKNTSWGTTKKIFMIFLIVIGWLDVIFYVIANSNNTEGIFMAIGFTQVMFKTVFIAYLKKRIWTVLNYIKNFWSLDKYGLTCEENNKQIFSKIRFCLKVFSMFLMGTVSIFTLRPLFEKNALIYPSFLFSGSARGSTMFLIAWILETVMAVCLVLTQLCFDLFYIALITNIVCEFKLLKAGFAQIQISMEPGTDVSTLKTLVELMQHHDLVLKCSKALRQLYYIPFMCIFFCNMLGIGVCLLCIIVFGNDNITMAFVFGLCAVFYITQLFLYCAPGTILIAESTEVSDVIFKTNWWIKTQPELRRAYVMILQRANRPEMLSAGGMVNVTLQSFTAILKNALSLFTFARATYKN